MVLFRRQPTRPSLYCGKNKRVQGCPLQQVTTLTPRCFSGQTVCPVTGDNDRAFFVPHTFCDGSIRPPPCAEFGLGAHNPFGSENFSNRFSSFVVAVFWLYRVGSLIHEVAHLGGHELRSFKVAWNLLVGVPTLTPSTFFTGHHRDHHTQRVYGTPEDPEYVVNVCPRGSLFNLASYFLVVALFPLLVFLRFLLAPLSFITPGIRNYVLRNLSAFTFNWKYKRQISRIDRKTFAALEMLCFVRAACIPGVALLGFAPWSRMLQLYLLGAAVVTLNQLRQLADHHFEGDGGQFSMSDHIVDSCNYANKDLLTWLFFPFAIQYHALHHLFPSLPYHNLAKAHAFLMHELPANSPYRELEQPGWWFVAKNMLRQPS